MSSDLFLSYPSLKIRLSEYFKAMPRNCQIEFVSSIFFLGIKVYVIDIDIIAVKLYSNKKELLFGIRLGCVLESLINIVKRLLKLT